MKFGRLTVDSVGLCFIWVRGTGREAMGKKSKEDYSPHPLAARPLPLAFL